MPEAISATGYRLLRWVRSQGDWSASEQAMFDALPEAERLAITQRLLEWSRADLDGVDHQITEALRQGEAERAAGWLDRRWALVTRIDGLTALVDREEGR